MKKIKTLFGLLAFFCLCSLGVKAQTTVSGTVQDETGEGLIGVNIVLAGTTTGTISDIQGNFTLQLPGESGELIFSYTGYADQRVSVDASNNTIALVMEEDISNLNEVVITGLATTVKRKNLANSVARVDAKQLTGIAAQTTTEGALVGKFKGAEIRNSSGAPGGGTSFKLRGTTSISGSSQPLIILDGVYIDNSSIPGGLNIVSAAAAGGSTSNQDNPSNRLADIDPNDIESIEILKGASTAAIYGSRAAGGVVIITSKKGQAGKTRVNFAQSFGVTTQLRELGVRQWDEEKVLASGFADQIDLFREARDNGTIDNIEELLLSLIHI